ncbi:MAG: S8 family serine peptidase [Bacteroidetes bacterium]|nr:S8 family serine peptidase [Bacteroidota bacterium]
MKKNLLLLGISFVFLQNIDAQFNRYIVTLKHKGNSPFSLSSPQTYLSARAIDRRTKYGISIDSADIPVTPSFVNQIDNIPNVTILNTSKWLNSVTIFTTDAAAITAINALPFVQAVSGIASRMADNGRGLRNKFAGEETITDAPVSTSRTEADFFNYGTNAFNEIHLHNGEFLHNIGLRGQGMQLAMLDNGYFNYTGLKAFDSAIANGQILGTWDFVARESNVANDGSHGMNCLSTIAANIPGQFIGKAPKASFWLFRTEDDASEYPIEEHNWVCAAERADSAGSDIISSSLGYYDFDNASLNYTYANMNGNTTISSRGADMAAKKGLLVFVSAGNEGGSAWHYLTTPSDADSAVCVGAVTATGVVGGFSSYGPSSDGQIKPDMASVGVSALVQTTGNTVGFANGTSFACPNMAGLGTCLWQGFPEFNNMKIVKAMQQAGSITGTPNDRIGYGIPNMKTAFKNLLIEYATSTATISNCNVTIDWRSKDMGAMKYEIERKAPGETVYTKIGVVTPAAATLLTNRTYQFNTTISGTITGSYSYRIRQLIDTATATLTEAYIDTVAVNFTTPCTTPVSEKVLVVIKSNRLQSSPAQLLVETPYAVTNLGIAVFDTKGRLVMQIRESKTAGSKTINLAVDRLEKGEYFVKVTNGNQLIGTAKMMKLF